MTASAPRISVLLLALVAVPAAICAAQELPTTASETFQTLDSNRDGAVTEDEYNSDRLFSALDSNRNNRISADELQAFLGPQQDGWLSAADRIRSSDLNLDGELTDEELRRSAETRFQWLDSNRDGKVELPELRSGFGIPLVK